MRSKKMNSKGFTLIEILAVIVILGLLIAIAIPSVSKYMTQSRKKTLVVTVNEYKNAVQGAVERKQYGQLVEAGTLYYIPISDESGDTCISLENGGTDPFGKWNKAYIVVAYDDVASKYTYYFTFYDSQGYGLPLTEIKDIDKSGKQITTNLPSEVKSATDIERQGIVGYDKVAILQTKPSSGEKCSVGTSVRKTAIPPKPKNGAELIISKSKPTSANAITSGEAYQQKQPATAQTQPQTEYRFLGSKANNYIKFNGETWRVIGVFNYMIKIVKNEPLSQVHPYSKNNNNNWKDSYLCGYLNNNYYSTISSKDKKYIASATWYLGGPSNSFAYDNNAGKSDSLYQDERGSKTGGTNAKSWTGKIALVYPTDFVYSNGAGQGQTYESCLDKKVVEWPGNQCLSNMWFKPTGYTYALSPVNDSNSDVTTIASNGQIGSGWNGGGGGASSYIIYPSLYLITDTQLKGTGTISNPYTIIY